ncbi:MAG: hypothetical protein ACK4SN_11980, partial [Bellilinea sp.]
MLSNLRQNSSKQRDARHARPVPSSLLNWLGVLPFFLFIFLFVFLPSFSLVSGSFQDRQGNFTFQNYLDLFSPSILSAYWVTIRISLASALGGGLLGFFM